MLELNFFIIIICFLTLNSLILNERKANLSKIFYEIFTFFFWSSKKYKKIFEISLNNKHLNNYILKVQNFVLSDLKHKFTKLNKSIHITRNISQHFTIY